MVATTITIATILIACGTGTSGLLQGQTAVSTVLRAEPLTWHRVPCHRRHRSSKVKTSRILPIAAARPENEDRWARPAEVDAVPRARRIDALAATAGREDSEAPAKAAIVGLRIAAHAKEDFVAKSPVEERLARIVRGCAVRARWGALVLVGANREKITGVAVEGSDKSTAALPRILGSR